jgi:deoxyribodipyrimidine photo-lyase
VAWQRFEFWARGETGYPLVDAAMRQLISTAWMHNRCRMVVASILTKNLGIDWRWGQEFFRATLLDLDEASNNGGWQWSASVGADPKPIRIFNPYLQAQKYDPNQAYIKKWLPVDYFVQPLVDHDLARKEARQRYGLS